MGCVTADVFSGCIARYPLGSGTYVFGVINNNPDEKSAHPPNNSTTTLSTAAAYAGCCGDVCNLFIRAASLLRPLFYAPTVETNSTGNPKSNNPAFPDSAASIHLRGDFVGICSALSV